MDISWEKEEIIRRFNQVNDADLIKAIKDLLDLGLNKQTRDERALNASIGRGISDSKKGLARPYEEFMAEVRKRYRA